MCAIYTAVPPPQTPEELTALARQNESDQYSKSPRKTMRPRAMLELVAMLAPPSRSELAKLILERDLWPFLTPAASRGNHAAALAQVHEDIAVPFPLWSESPIMACLVGTPPAHYIGNNLVMLPPEVVSIGVAALDKHEDNELVAFLNEFLRRAADKEFAVLLHWDHR
jgi:hypothetical protein